MRQYQTSGRGSFVALAVRSDGRVVQVPGAAPLDWPIRYIMTFAEFRTALATLFGARR